MNSRRWRYSSLQALLLPGRAGPSGSAPSAASNFPCFHPGALQLAFSIIKWAGLDQMGKSCSRAPPTGSHIASLKTAPECRVRPLHVVSSTKARPSWPGHQPPDPLQPHSVQGEAQNKYVPFGTRHLNNGECSVGASAWSELPTALPPVAGPLASSYPRQLLQNTVLRPWPFPLEL